MQALNLKPTHAPVTAYYQALGHFGHLYVDHEMAVRSAFQELLSKCGRKVQLTLVPEYRIERARNSSVIVDGALVDIFHLPHGYWEAKDEKDNFEKEVKLKLDKGYPRDNIIFQSPTRAILYQAGMRVRDEDISRPEPLVDVVNQFFGYKAPHIEEWERAVEDFSERIPELAAAVKKIIDEERRRNPAFVCSFDDFYALCQQAINPNLSVDAVERMLVQHLLTERIFRKIFNNPDFTRRNVVAAEIEKVISALTSRSFNRDEFLSNLNRFYKAIEQSAENTSGFAEKQAFLNKVYERFFQGYSTEEADTHGIVYTPQPIVNFMVRSVGEILQQEFGRSLSEKGVHVLDPFVGTGNFIVRLMHEIKTTGLTYKYQNELHCNEIMLLPYYIASMNIEHAFFERTGEYLPFPGNCLVDTFDMRAQSTFFTEANTERIEAQRRQPIFVVIGNPPYNAWQANENDNNRNRKYEAIDDRVSETYAKSSTASNKNALSDPYVKAIRWASDRIKEEGIVALVTNSGFVDGLAADGMRAHLAGDFDEIYILDLGGNVRKNPRLSGTTHNVFGIQVGVSINIFVRRHISREKRVCRISYARAEKDWTRWEKYRWLDQIASVSGTEWVQLRPDSASHWLSEGIAEDFDQLISMERVFDQQSRGVATSRDTWAYNFNASALEENISKTIGFFNEEVTRWKERNNPDNDEDINNFVRYDESALSWSRDLKQDLKRARRTEFTIGKIRESLYRPFTRLKLFFDRVLNEEVYVFPAFFPTKHTETENKVICLTGPGSEKPFLALGAQNIVDLHLSGAGCSTQCFPFYTYAEDGTARRENINDWSVEQFHAKYDDPSITKWDIFHYVYAVLHHPEYRQRYSANLKRELPRVPFVAAVAGSGRKDTAPFHSFAAAGKRLTEIHVNYEKQPEYPLTKREKAGEKLDWRVTKMRLSKDKTSLIYNQFLTLSGIPPETYEYRLGNRSALEWVIDQYQVSTDKRSGITNDPNRDDDPEYIVRLIGQVIAVSLETVKIVAALPSLGI